MVCKPGPDIENMTNSKEKEPLINGGKNAISACNYYILWFMIVNYNYLMQSLKLKKKDWNWKKDSFCIKEL